MIIVRKTIEAACVVCIGLPCLVLGYVANFAISGFVTGYNLNTKRVRNEHAG